MRASVSILGVSLALLMGLAGCDDPTARVLFDLEGPQGQADAPGPWTLAALTDGTEPVFFFALDDDEFIALPTRQVGDGQFVTVVQPLPVGARFRYYVEAGGETLPADAPRRVEVVSAALTANDAGLGRCSLSFRTPRDGQTLREELDDSAPQHGLQFTVIVETDLPDGHAVRLDVSSEGTTVGYADVAGAAQVGFRDVSLPVGQVRLRAQGRRDGAQCEAVIDLVVSVP